MDVLNDDYTCGMFDIKKVEQFKLFVFNKPTSWICNFKWRVLLIIYRIALQAIVLLLSLNR